MQSAIDFVTANAGFFVALAVFVLVTLGLVFALRTEAGRASLARAAVRLAVALIAAAESWLGRLITPPLPAGTRAAGDTQSPRQALENWLRQ